MSREEALDESEMSENRPDPSLTPWVISALAASAWGIIAITFASLAPTALIPHLFFSYHVEHFSAFYVLSVVAAAGLPRVGLARLSLNLIIFATVLELVRMATPAHKLTSAEDLVCDIAGVLAAYVPILVGRARAAIDDTPR